MMAASFIKQVIETNTRKDSRDYQYCHVGSGTRLGYPPVIRSKDERLGLRQMQPQEQLQKRNSLTREKTTATNVLPAQSCRKETVDRAVAVIDRMTTARTISLSLALSSYEKIFRKLPFFIDPLCIAIESRIGGDSRYLWQRVFVTALGPDGFSLCEDDR